MIKWFRKNFCSRTVYINTYTFICERANREWTETGALYKRVDNRDDTVYEIYGKHKYGISRYNVDAYINNKVLVYE